MIAYMSCFELDFIARRTNSLKNIMYWPLVGYLLFVFESNANEALSHDDRHGQLSGPALEVHSSL
jgi:hypothetical protein